MDEHADLDARCRRCVSDLSRRNGWDLSDLQIETYVEQLLQRVPVEVLDKRMELVAGHFHADHERVATLSNPDVAAHAEMWAWVEREIGRVAQIKGLSWSRDPAIDRSDLVQTVMVEVVRSIAAYHFESSLRTWLQAVVVRRLRRVHRDNGAQKRGGQTLPLDAVEEPAQEWAQSEPPILASVLADEVRRILASTGDDRYLRIVLMRGLGDLTNEEIGERLSLHPSRIRTLMKIARDRLREHPRLRDWERDELDHDDDDPE